MQRMMTGFMTIIFAVLMMVSAGVRAQDGNVDKGGRLYLEYGCYACHGYQAHGGRGPKLGPDALPYSAFSGIVRAGQRGMPQYTAGVVPDGDLTDIYAFVASVASSPEAKDLPLLRGGVGVYTQ